MQKDLLLAKLQYGSTSFRSTSLFPLRQIEFFFGLADNRCPNKVSCHIQAGAAHVEQSIDAQDHRIGSSDS